MIEYLDLILILLYLQALNDTLEAVYERYNCLELITAEYIRRASSHPLNSGSRRRHSLVCVFTKFEEPNVPEYYAIEIGKYFIELTDGPISPKSHLRNA